MEERTELIRAYGAREIMSGIGILAQQDSTPWIWARVGGDALDLATLATGLDDDNPRKQNVMAAVAAVVTVLDAICAQRLSSAHRSRAATRRQLPARDYSDGRGMPRPPEAKRGAARSFEAPRDMRIPEAMRPYRRGNSPEPVGAGA